MVTFESRCTKAPIIYNHMSYIILIIFANNTGHARYSARHGGVRARGTCLTQLSLRGSCRFVAAGNTRRAFCIENIVAVRTSVLASRWVLAVQHYGTQLPGVYIVVYASVDPEYHAFGGVATDAL